MGLLIICATSPTTSALVESPSMSVLVIWLLVADWWGGRTHRHHGRHCNPLGIGMGGRCMLDPAAPVKLSQARLVAIVFEVPPTVLRVPGPTDA